MDNEENLPKRIVRTITLTNDDLMLLDGIERTMSRTGQRIKTDSKLIRAAIQIASKSLNNENYDLMEIAEKVVREDGRTLSKLLEKSKKIDRPVDGFLQLFWLTGQKISCIFPSGISDITQNSCGSTLSIKQSIKSSIYRSLIRFFYRMRIKIYSIIYKKILIKDIS